MGNGGSILGTPGQMILELQRQCGLVALGCEPALAGSGIVSSAAISYRRVEARVESVDSFSQKKKKW